MKNSFFNNLCTFISVLMVGFVFANPDFDSDGDGQYDNLSEFNDDYMNVTAIVNDGFFGTVDESRVEMMLGRDFILEGYEDGIVNLFIYPILEIDDKESSAFSKRFSYKNL